MVSATQTRNAAASLSTGTVHGRRATPIKWWATLGAGFLLLQGYVFGRWLLSGPKPTPRGATEPPGWMQAAAYAHEVAGILAAIVLLHLFVVRPWRRAGRLSFDGLLVLSFLTMYWQDLGSNYLSVTVLYNTIFHQWGSWFSYIPGWMLPNGNLTAEPVLFIWPIYVSSLFAPIIVGGALMARAQRRWPQLGRAGLVGICYVFFLVFDFTVESVWTRLGLWVYPGAIKGVTLFHGHYYQFPIYEALVMAGLWTAWSCIRYFRNDRGETIVERGVGSIRLGPRQTTVVRFLAFVGVFNLTLLCLYNLPLTVLHLQSSAWPEDIVKRSYLTNGLCGPGTTFACPGPDVPIPRRGSARVSPEGTLFVPAGGLRRNAE